MRKSSVGSATGIDNGCVIAFPREKTIAIRGSTSSTSLPEVSANPSAVSSLRLDRNRLGMAYKQADQGLEQDADLRNFAVQNLIVQQFQVGQSKSGQRSARLPLSSSAVMDHAVAGSQMVPDRQSRSSPFSRNGFARGRIRDAAQSGRRPSGCCRPKRSGSIRLRSGPDGSQ